MRIVIDIPEKELYKIEHDRVITDEQRAMLFCAITNGTVLPKGHGDLIDKKELMEVLETEMINNEDTRRRATLSYVFTVIVARAKAVIKGDKNE